MARTASPFSDRLLPWLAIGLPTLFGLGLRIAAAQGDYWLDEAWSAVFAREAGTVGRVFFAINHDNNHFLNTLWLQSIGWGAPPMLGRALSIACGTAGIAVAGLIGARRGVGVAAVTAGVFAISPILVTYGSEARGYAPMLLALLTAIWIVDRQLFGAPVRHAPIWLGVAALLGMLAHVSMLFGVAALTGWAAIEHGRRMTPGTATRATLVLMGRAVGAVIAVLLLVAMGASPHGGLRMGSLTPFDAPAFADALAHMAAYTIGWPFRVGPSLLFLLLLPLVARRTAALRDRTPFHLLAILGLPLLVLLVQPDNSAFPRYYLLSAVALLLLLPDLLPIRRRPLAIVLGAVALGCLLVDAQIIANRRADPGAAVDAMNERHPSGAGVMLEDARDSAVLESAAASRVYLLLTTPSCAGARYLYVSNNGAFRLPPVALRCGAVFRPVASGDVHGLSGMAWQLYERVP